MKQSVVRIFLVICLLWFTEFSAAKMILTNCPKTNYPIENTSLKRPWYAPLPGDSVKLFNCYGDVELCPINGYTLNIRMMWEIKIPDGINKLCPIAYYLSGPYEETLNASNYFTIDKEDYHGEMDLPHDRYVTVDYELSRDWFQEDGFKRVLNKTARGVLQIELNGNCDDSLENATKLWCVLANVIVNE